MLENLRDSAPSMLRDEEVSNDAVQLITVSLFNGVCRMITALAENGFMTADQLAGMHDAMTTPLDDPSFAMIRRRPRRDRRGYGVASQRSAERGSADPC